MRWSSHHARLKRTSAVFCQSLALPHELRSRSGLRKKDSRTTPCNGCVDRTLLKISVFLRMFLPPALHCSRKRERLNSSGGRERKEVIWSEKFHRLQEVIATMDRPLGAH